MLNFDSILLLIITLLALFESAVTCMVHWKTAKKIFSKKKRRSVKPKLKVVAGGRDN